MPTKKSDAGANRHFSNLSRCYTTNPTFWKVEVQKSYTYLPQINLLSKKAHFLNNSLNDKMFKIANIWHYCMTQTLITVLF